MKRTMIISCALACLVIVWSPFPAFAKREIPLGATAVQVHKAQKTSRVRPMEDSLLRSVDISDKRFIRLENTMLRKVSFFHTRRIGEAIVENDFIRYKFNTETGELIKKTVKWRDDLPEQITPVITAEEAESMVEGEPLWSKLYFISPNSTVFPIKPTPKNACWVVRSIDGEDRHIVTIIDAMTGENLGLGVPPPYAGFSLGGPNHGSCAPYYTTYAQNAAGHFADMGYDTEMVDCPDDAKVQSHIQSDDTALFYELAHGGSYDFRNGCYDDELILSSQIDTWMASYTAMPLAFIGSCLGLCAETDGTFSWEFRKGLDGYNSDTVVVGYCGMSWPQCSDCWDWAMDWQNSFFAWLKNGYQAGTAYAQANLDYPDCTDEDHLCMRINGDTNLRFAGNYPGTSDPVPKVTRSWCGAIHDNYIDWPSYDYFPILKAVKSPADTRAHHIRCSSWVPSGSIIRIGVTSADKPWNEVAFDNNSKITAYGNGASGYPFSLKAYVSGVAGGAVTLISAEDHSKGIKILNSGALKAVNGGQIKVYE